MVQNEKKFCLSRSISQEAYIIWLSFEVHRCNMMISPGICYIFSKFWIFWFLGGWLTGQKMIHNYQFQSVTLSNSRTVDHIMKIVGTQVWNNDISRCFSLFFFFFKYNIVTIKILTFFIGPPQHLLLINSCFSSSSINVKQVFLSVFNHLHMCVIFHLIFEKWFIFLCQQILMKWINYDFFLLSKITYGRLPIMTVLQRDQIYY